VRRNSGEIQFAQKFAIYVAESMVTPKLIPFAAAPEPLRMVFDAVGRPEASWAWFETLASTTLAADEEAYVASLVKGDDKFVSAIPVVAVANRLTRGLTAPYSTCFQPPLGNLEHARALGEFVGRHIHGSFRIDAVDSDNDGVAAFALGLSRGGLIRAQFNHFANWFETIPDFASYWATRNSQLRSTLKRKVAGMARSGQSGFEIIDLVHDRKKGVEIYQAIYAKSWKPPEPHPTFIAKLLDALGPSGSAQMGVATIAGEPAAVQIWLVRPPLATIFKLAHDPKFDRHSPGSLLTYWLLRHFCENEDVTEVDFGRGDDTYKKNWLHSRRYRYGVIAANPRTLSGLSTCLFDVAPTLLSTFLRERLVKAKSSS
jgi:Acetyltransferase (GNAT) domain